MNTKNMTQEQISAFADGELPDAQFESALGALRGSDSRATWELYHQIGDALRSDDMAVKLSADFSARMAMRLEQEPTIIAPVVVVQPQLSDAPAAPAAHPIKRRLLQGVAAAAAAAGIAFVATPQLMVATKDAPTVNAATMLASAPQSAPVAEARVVAQQGGEVLRDARIDEYLLAHQRFSPSVYSTAQYARSATFAIDSDN
jgi:sigma-E factor negative regulatory protein RseA